MTALVRWKAELGLWLEDVLQPQVGEDVLIRVLRPGICGTDLHIYRWARPVDGRHESVGIVAEMGRGSTWPRATW